MSATCPKHNRPYIPMGFGVLACPEPNCPNGTTVNAIEDKQDKQKREAQPIRPKVYEKDLQIEVKSNLEMRGYEVMETGKSRAKVSCPACGSQSYPTGWQGNTSGLPDLLIRRQDWPVGIWLAVELKGTSTAVTTAQQALANRYGSYICRSWEEVWSAVVIQEGEWTE